MQIIETINDIRKNVADAKQNGKTIGFFPTMGYLHEGHLALVDRAKLENDIVVVSIFVNPLQFGPNEDFDAYPRDISRDASLLKEHGCDLLFAPSTPEIYPVKSLTSVQVAKLGTGLCGKSRPSHFQGVTTVVSKLLNIVQPHRAYFGQKDGQQLIIIKRMVADLNIPVEIIGNPIVREADGLARSSRNIYLTPEERPHAAIVYQTLKWVKCQIESGERDANTLIAAMKNRMENEPYVRLDYAEIVDLDTLQPISRVIEPCMVAVAAFVGKARLIDNIQIHL